MSSRSTMNTRTDDTDSARSYELRCVDCAFEMTVEGDVFQVLDLVDAHQEKYAVDSNEHFVEFESEMAKSLADDDQD